MRVLVTGGAGFIGSNFIRLLLRELPGWEIVNFDLLTYAGNLDNLAEVASSPPDAVGGGAKAAGEDQRIHVIG